MIDSQMVSLALRHFEVAQLEELMQQVTRLREEKLNAIASKFERLFKNLQNVIFCRCSCLHEQLIFNNLGSN